jgi:hypothetical protein
MKTLILRVVLLSTLADFALAADFSKWWPEFQAAVVRNDARAVAALAHFPMNWENGKIRDIKTEGDFVKGFATYFTPEIRKAIATRKTERLPNGSFILTWKARGNEYSLYFKPEGSAFALDGLSEGPE